MKRSLLNRIWRLIQRGLGYKRWLIVTPYRTFEVIGLEEPPQFFAETGRIETSL